MVGPGEVAVCPGQLFRHYAPSARLVLTQEFQDGMQGTVLGFSDRQYPVGCQRFILGPSDALETVAENLYRTLRRLDEENIQQAFVDMRIPQEGLWITILERLTKASVK